VNKNIRDGLMLDNVRENAEMLAGTPFCFEKRENSDELTYTSRVLNSLRTMTATKITTENTDTD